MNDTLPDGEETQRWGSEVGQLEERTGWAIEPAVNPSVVRVHVTRELTDQTIVTSPPAELDRPIAGLLEIEAVRTIDVHRYRIRLNLRQGADRARTAAHARDILAAA